MREEDLQKMIGCECDTITLKTISGRAVNLLVPVACEFPRANELMEYAIAHHKCQYHGPLPVTRILPNFLICQYIGGSYVRGSFVHDTKEIWINGLYTYGVQASTWVHEATHFLQLVVDLDGDPVRMCDSVAGIIEREIQAYMAQRQWLLDTKTEDPYDALALMSEIEIRRYVEDYYSESSEQLVASRSNRPFNA